MRIPANSRGILAIVYSLFMFEVVIYVIFAKHLISSDLFLFIGMSILTAIFLLSMIYFRFSKIYTAVMVIDKNGVKLDLGKEVYSMQWDEMRMIGVTACWNSKRLEMIVFSKRYVP